VNIAILIEGDTEKSFLPVLRNFLDTDSRPKGRMPRFIPIVHKGRIPKNEKLKREVETLLTGRTPDAEHVIALTDVNTGTNDFQDARDAREKMRTGWALNLGSIPMRPSMILRRGCSLTGRRFCSWRSIT